jgi:predicted dehydrogenase
MTAIGVALIGYGTMGRAHSYAYAAAPRIRSLPVTPVLRVVSGRDAAAVQQAAQAFGAESHVTDWPSTGASSAPSAPPPSPTSART